jgi:ATP-dependent helicase/nuclease subunit A
MFRGCARRFRFRYLLGLEEPVASGQLDLFALAALFDESARDDERGSDADPRALGRAAHRVLQRWPAERWGAPTSPGEVAVALIAEGFTPGNAETTRMAAGIAALLEGPYAAAIGMPGAELHREEEFVLAVAPFHVEGPRGDSSAAPRRKGSARAPRGASEGLFSQAPVLALRGAMDLLVAHADGMVDVIDYKRSAARADLTPYEFQLRAYALAARNRYPGQPVRAGVLYLGGPIEPTFLRGAGERGAFADDEHDAFERELSSLAGRYAQARYEDRWDGVPVERCKQLHCGFVHVCHTRAARTAGSG